MAYDYFLKLEGFVGPSTDLKHKGELPVTSFSFGMKLLVSATGGLTSAKGQAVDLTVGLPASVVTPQLLVAASTGRAFPTAVLSVRNQADKTQTDIFRVYLGGNVIATGYSAAGAGDFPHDSLTLSFARIEIEYTDQKSDMTLGAVSRAGFDLVKNLAI